MGQLQLTAPTEIATCYSGLGSEFAFSVYQNQTHYLPEPNPPIPTPYSPHSTLSQSDSNPSLFQPLTCSSRTPDIYQNIWESSGLPTCMSTANAALQQPALVEDLFQTGQNWAINAYNHPELEKKPPLTTHN